MKMNKLIQTTIILGLFSYKVAATGGHKYDMNNSVEKSHPSVLFILDVSGSMRGSPLSDAKSTIGKAVNKLRPYAYLGLISFSGCAHNQIITEVPLGFGTHDRVINKANALYTKGGTNIYQALVHARAEMRNAPSNTCTKVILLTDGFDGCGEGDIPAITKEVVGGGSSCNSVDIISIGIDDWEGEVLDEIAEAGNGEHTQVDDSEEVDEVVEQILVAGTSNAIGDSWGGDYSGEEDQSGNGRPKRPKKDGGATLDQPKDLTVGQGQSQGNVLNGKK